MNLSRFSCVLLAVSLNSEHKHQQNVESGQETDLFNYRTEAGNCFFVERQLSSIDPNCGGEFASKPNARGIISVKHVFLEKNVMIQLFLKPNCCQEHYIHSVSIGDRLRYDKT
ncbi:hypothetical protein WA026_014324 [Henosepilachna vigintioctopunctata]|uniref:Secreted protein n=1 Tax=Henosepilachna vigintioctopunctata TaxID=420089 RepID=A0AAW1UE82_9CUCU